MVTARRINSMPLPEKVIEQLGQEPPQTQGWALGALFFSGGILFLTVAVYFGLTLGYEPYLQSQLANAKNQVNALGNSVSASDQSQLIDFYSQIANLQTLLQKHTFSSQFFSWLEQNTEANVYYRSFALTQGDQIALSGVAVLNGLVMVTFIPDFLNPDTYAWMAPVRQATFRATGATPESARGTSPFSESRILSDAGTQIVQTRLWFLEIA